MFNPERVPSEPSKKTIKERFKRVAKNPLTQALALSAALHVPVVTGALETAKEKSSEVWERANTVLYPQSPEEAKILRQKIAERNIRKDDAHVQAQSKKIRTQLERGEQVSFKEIFFDLEEVNGVDPATVVQAKKQAESLILKYSQAANGQLEESLIRRMVNELYGPSEAHFWGQASVSDYFVSGQHNCKSYARGELIVFEGVIASLPKHEQERFMLGQRFVKQHVIATLSVRETHGKDFSKIYLLEPGSVMEDEDSDLAGTVDAPSAIIKKALVSEKPIHIIAQPGRVKNSPDLATVSNEPVADGFVIEGKLRGSDFNRDEIVRQEIVPIANRTGSKDPLSIEIEYNVTDPGVEVAKKRRHEATELFEELGKVPTFDDQIVIDAKDFVKPSIESIRALAGTAEGEVPMFISRIEFGDVAGWDKASIREMLKIQTDILSIKPTTQGSLVGFTGDFFEAFAEAANDPNGFGWNQLYIDLPPLTLPPEVEGRDGHWSGEDSSHLPTAQLSQLLDLIRFNAHAKELEIGFPYKNILKAEAKEIAQGGLHGVHLSDVASRSQLDVFEVLDQGNQRIYLPFDAWRALPRQSDHLHLDVTHLADDELPSQVQIQTLQDNGSLTQDQSELLKAVKFEKKFREDPYTIDERQRPDY